MSESVADDERSNRVVALLEDKVRTELRVTDGMFDLGLNAEAIERLMQGVTAGLLSAFAVDWSPGWVEPGDIHGWEEHGLFFALCGVCLADSPPSPDEQTAVAWARHHETSHSREMSAHAAVMSAVDLPTSDSVEPTRDDHRMTSKATGQVIVEFGDDGYISRISRLLADGSTAWEKVPDPKDSYVAVSMAVFDQLTWNTYSAYHVTADLVTGEELERQFTK